MRQGAVRLLRAPSSGSSATLALGGAEVVAAFEVIRDELEVHERFKLRSVLKVPAPSEMTPGSVAERIATEMKALSKAIATNAATNGRHGAIGAKRFVTSDAVLVDMDWDGDAALKYRHAPVISW